MLNCKCKCVKDPSGVWDYQDLIGAKVTVKSMPVGNFFKMSSTSKNYIIKDIYFRCSLDGKVITLIELEGDEFEGIYFNWKDLIVIDIPDHPKKTICNEVDSSCKTIVC